MCNNFSLYDKVMQAKHLIAQFGIASLLKVCLSRVKNAYNLNYIRAKTALISEAWINSIFINANRVIFYVLNCHLASANIALH